MTEQLEAAAVDDSPTTTTPTITTPTIAQDIAHDDAEFLTMTGRFRPELLAHCYRMLGSVHDAEDLVQETYLRAWKSYHGFEGRASMRTWLYRIATNACLTALEGRSRRPLPTGLGQPGADPNDPLVERPEVPWLQPVPDAAAGAAEGDPAAVVAARSGTRLALIAALQYLPARQRAVLVLRDVLRLRATEVAEILDTSTAAVNSSLQRAHAQLAQADLAEDDITEPTDPQLRHLLDRYADALERKDVPAVIQLFTAETVWEMPPFEGWYRGPDDIGTLIDLHCPAGPDELRLFPVQANGQPGFAMYMLHPDGAWRAFQLHVLTLRGHGPAATIAHVSAFMDESLFPTFGLPLVLPESGEVPAAARS